MEKMWPRIQTLQIAFSLFLWLTCNFLDEAESYSLSINVSPSQDLEIGSEFSVHCDVSPRDKHVIIQVIKTEVRLKLPGEDRVFGSAEHPVVISNDVHLNLDVAKVTDRYRVREDTPGAVVLSVDNAQPEDSGDWGCRLLNVDTNIQQMEPLILKVLIRGPLRSVSISHSTDPLLKDETNLAGSVSLKEGEAYNMYCLVNMVNVVPEVSVKIQDEKGNVVEDFTDSLDIQSQMNGQTEAGMMVKTSAELRLKHNEGQGLNALYTYHNKKYTCRAHVPPYRPLTTSVTLNVTFYPRELRCDRKTFGGPTGTKNFQMTCKVKSNPAPRFNWRTPRINLEDVGQVGEYNLTTQEGLDGLYISTLTITEVKDIHHGEYFVRTTNKLGAKSTTIVLVNRVISTSSVAEPFIWIQLLTFLICAYLH